MTDAWLPIGLKPVLAVQLRPVLGVAVFVVSLFAAVMFHEFGHYYMARRSGMKVTEFFFGFGPRIWSTKRSTKVREADGGRELDVETEFGIKALPFGGYVKITGMSAQDEVADEDRGFTYAGKPFRQKVAVVAAGPIANVATAFVLLAVLAMVGALPDQEVPVPRVAELIPPFGCVDFSGTSSLTGQDCSAPTPAQSAGLQPGDEFVSADGYAITRWEDVRKILEDKVGKEIVFTVVRDGRTMEVPVIVGERPPLEGEAGRRPFLGIAVDTERQRDDPAAAVLRASKYTVGMSVAAVDAIGRFFTPSNLKRYFGLLGGSQDEEANANRFVSPIGLGRISAQAAQAGWEHLLFTMVVFNLFLGLFNALPLYPLDGGHFAIAAFERVATAVKGRPVHVDIRKLAPIAAAVVAVFLFLAVTSLYLDVTNPIEIDFR